MKTISLKDFGIKRHKTTLSNGIPLFLYEKQNAPVHIRMLFKGGSRYDPKGKEGLAHFVEHLCVTGTKNFPAADKLFAYLENIGGYVNAYTSSDTLAIDLEVADAKDIDHAVTVLKETTLHPLFKEKTIETERGSILRELGDYASTPARYLWELQRKLIYQKTDVGRSILGSEKSIKSIAKKDLVNYYKTKITGRNACIVASGGISIDKLRDILEERLPLEKQVPPSQKIKAVPIYREKSVSVKNYKGINQIHLNFNFRTCPWNNIDSVPLELLSCILGGGFVSTLYKKLRHEKGLVYGVRASNTGLLDSGFWGVKTSTDKKTLQEVIDIIAEEIKNVAEGKITKKQLTFAQNKIIKSRKRQMQTVGSWVGWHAYGDLMGIKSCETVDEFLNAVAKTRVEELQTIAKKYFKPNKWYLTMCGDISENDVRVNF